MDVSSGEISKKLSKEDLAIACALNAAAYESVKSSPSPLRMIRLRASRSRGNRSIVSVASALTDGDLFSIISSGEKGTVRCQHKGNGCMSFFDWLFEVSTFFIEDTAKFELRPPGFLNSMYTGTPKGACCEVYGWAELEIRQIKIVKHKQAPCKCRLSEFQDGVFTCNR